MGNFEQAIADQGYRDKDEYQFKVVIPVFFVDSKQAFTGNRMINQVIIKKVT